MSWSKLKSVTPDPPWWVYGCGAVWASGSMIAQAIAGFPAPWYELILVGVGILVMAGMAYFEWVESIEAAREIQEQ